MLTYLTKKDQIKLHTMKKFLKELWIFLFVGGPEKIFLLFKEKTISNQEEEEIQYFIRNLPSSDWERSNLKFPAYKAKLQTINQDVLVMIKEKKIILRERIIFEKKIPVSLIDWIDLPNLPQWNRGIKIKKDSDFSEFFLLFSRNNLFMLKTCNSINCIYFIIWKSNQKVFRYENFVIYLLLHFSRNNRRKLNVIF